MRGSLIACAAAAAAALHATPGAAADRYLYVVNAAAAPLVLSIDARPFPLMAHLHAIAYRSEPGQHVLVAGAPEKLTPAMREGREPLPEGGAISTVNLSLSDAIRDSQQREFWCFFIIQKPDGGMRIISADQPTCTKLIERGVGDRPLH